MKQFNAHTQFLGVYPIFPHYYLVAVQICFDAAPKILWQERIYFEQWELGQSRVPILPIPWSFGRICLSTCAHRTSVYWGMQRGVHLWSALNYQQMEFEEYLLRAGPAALDTKHFELDMMALWNYAYWLLEDIQGFQEIILWVLACAQGYYLLLGRDENLWLMEVVPVDFSLTLWLERLTWPLPQRIVCFNQEVLSDASMIHIPIMSLKVEHYAWCLAKALAIRGAYAALSC